MLTEHYALALGCLNDAVPPIAKSVFVVNRDANFFLEGCVNPASSLYLQLQG